MTPAALYAWIIVPGAGYILASVAWQLSRWFGDWA